MNMLIGIVDVHSIQRCERLAGLLIDLLNSNDCRNFMAKKLSPGTQTIISHFSHLSCKVSETKRAAKDKLGHLETLLNRSLYESLQCMQQILKLVTNNIWVDDEIEKIKRLMRESRSMIDVDALADLILTPPNTYYVLTKASKILADQTLSDSAKVSRIWRSLKESRPELELGAIARENIQRNFDDKPNVLEDFEKGIKRCKIGVDDFLNSVHDYIRCLEAKLTAAQNAPLNHILAPFAKFGGIIGANETAGKARRFQKRKRGNWFQSTESFLFQYIQGNKTDGELWNFLMNEELEADLDDIRRELRNWIRKMRVDIDGWNIPVVGRWENPNTPKFHVLNKTAIVTEIKRTWAFAKALLLDGDEHEITLHSRLLEEAMIAACNPGCTAPVISLGHLADGSRELKMKFVVSAGPNVDRIRQIVDGLAQLTNGRVSGGGSDGWKSGSISHRVQ